MERGRMGNHNMKLKPVKIVIFGAGGDLTQRKLMPALYNLYLDKLMPDNFSIIGVDIKDLDDDSVRKNIHEGIDEFSRRGKADKNTWAAFEPNLSYLKGDFTDDKTYAALAKMLAGSADWEAEANHLYYLALPPFLIEPISQHLYKAKLMHDPAKDRLIV